MVYYKLIKVTINASRLAKVILDVVVWHHNISDSIVTDRDSFFISKFWLSLYYFLAMKQKLFIIFYLQIDGQTKRQNSTIEDYFLAFVTYEQND